MITIAALRDRMKLSPDRDGELEGVRATVIALWEAETQRLWDRRVGHIEVIRPRHDRLDAVLLGLWPIEVVTKVEERDAGETDWTEITDWKLIGQRELVNNVAFWAAEVRVTYTGGYAAEPAVGQFGTPYDIREALLVQAKFMDVRLANERLITKSQNFEGGQGVFEEATLHPMFRMIAQRKRRIA